MTTADTGSRMANLVYKRVSTDQQSTDRQNLVLAEAGIEDLVVFEETAGTSSRLHPPERPKFGELLTYARPGDTVHISEMFRLVRGTGHILDVLDVLHRAQVALRIHDGAFFAMDLTARHPRTGELLSTVKFMVQTLAAAGELQRDLQRELTYDGLRAAEAKGNKRGRRPAIPADKTDSVRTAYLNGQSIASLAREHDVSRGAIRTVVADLLPEHTPVDPGAPTPELPFVLDMPGKVADFLRATDLEPAERAPLDQGVTVRRAARDTPCASAPRPRSTANSSPAANPWTAPRGPRQSRRGAKPAANTRAASAPSGLPPDHDQRLSVNRELPSTKAVFRTAHLRSEATGGLLVTWFAAR
ncbi:recombinase family protein [Streptomyces sp. NBC_00481]|uniref:recombinase family protein n=1 Tax=Streptomyces sp. NBC_00481 TaxID=2975755 RepID=UPI002DD968E4|nr:recombinase family protein [Streptomyces sp. NBC_00481]WRZ00163.1 recombinase family protein [Streptomyces sp. NBC_00481]